MQIKCLTLHEHCRHKSRHCCRKLEKLLSRKILHVLTNCSVIQLACSFSVCNQFRDHRISRNDYLPVASFNRKFDSISNSNIRMMQFWTSATQELNLAIQHIIFSAYLGKIFCHPNVYVEAVPLAMFPKLMLTFSHCAKSQPKNSDMSSPTEETPPFPPYKFH